ncbi:uncharacterized protein LOC122706907 isoform X8 [Cervus elaphus]|uniref:uncharacterized protein LOC122706907 isoform X8 n=1 Tax=Cervus elaphus TaxID=9860 RepID=UPI001CC2FE26|nr:uncharacterized protein LOC122706907 isoform X8 [Cervus elaphus]
MRVSGRGRLLRFRDPGGTLCPPGDVPAAWGGGVGCCRARELPTQRKGRFITVPALLSAPRHCPSAPWVGVFRNVSCSGGSASVLGPAGSTPPLGIPGHRTIRLPQRLVQVASSQLPASCPDLPCPRPSLTWDLEDSGRRPWGTSVEA